MDTLKQLIWETRYRAPEFNEQSPSDSFQRVASALAAAESTAKQKWQDTFFQMMENNLFLPGGRILANAGRHNDATLANCFVAAPLVDSLDSIFANLRDCAITLQAGGGIGIDFSPLRPDGWPAIQHDRIASGPVSFLDVWNQMSETLLRNNPRRGAMMGVLDCSHPDIFAFIKAKNNPQALHHFNLSVAICDDFMQSLAADADWKLQFAGKTMRQLPTRQIWDTLLASNLSGGEPGVLFIDRINHANRLGKLESIRATNPCGELPLPPHGACLLGSLVLPNFIEHAFTPSARLNSVLLQETVRDAVRMLDNAVDQAHLPLPAQRQCAARTRRIGIGITGLADALIMLGVKFDSEEARAVASQIAAQIRFAAYASSSELAAEKGAFPVFDATSWLNNSLVAPLEPELAQQIQHQGIRNSHVTAIAPAGTLSLMAGNVSSSIEPVFDWEYTRHLQTREGTVAIKLENYALQKWRELKGDAKLPDVFRRAAQIDVVDQIKMAAAIQPYIDSAISKTVALPADATRKDVDNCYRLAYQNGLKGLTCFPATSSRGCVLESGDSSCA